MKTMQASTKAADDMDIVRALEIRIVGAWRRLRDAGDARHKTTLYLTRCGHITQESLQSAIEFGTYTSSIDLADFREDVLFAFGIVVMGAASPAVRAYLAPYQVTRTPKAMQIGRAWHLQPASTSAGWWRAARG